MHSTAMPAGMQVGEADWLRASLHRDCVGPDSRGSTYYFFSNKQEVSICSTHMLQQP